MESLPLVLFILAYSVIALKPWEEFNLSLNDLYLLFGTVAPFTDK